MNKRLLSFLFLLFVLPASSLIAFDFTWGGGLNLNGEAPELQGTVLAVSSTDSLNLWFGGSWNRLFNMKADASFVYETDYRYGVALDTQELGYFGKSSNSYPAIKEMNLYGSLDQYYYRVGRQILEDPGRLIVSHSGDGILLGSRFGATSLDVQAVYTGYVHENASTLNLSVNDLAADHPADFTSPRMIEKLTWSLPGFYRQSLVLSFLAQQDLHQSDDMVTGSEKLHSQYLEVVMKGFVIPSVTYRISLAGESGGYGEASIWAGVGRLEAGYLPENGHSTVGIDVISSTGDSWDRTDYYASGIGEDVDSLNQYIPISSVSGQGYVEVFELGNITTVGVFYAVNPKDSFSAELRGTTFLRTTPGPVSSTLVLDDNNDSAFIGEEGLLSFMITPASDVSVGFRTGVLYMGDIITIAEDLEKYLPVLMRAGMDISLRF